MHQLDKSRRARGSGAAKLTALLLLASIQEQLGSASVQVPSQPRIGPERGSVSSKKYMCVIAAGGFMSLVGVMPSDACR